MAFRNTGHRKIPGKRGFYRYTVYNNRTDELVILDGTAQECARAMNLTIASFYSAVSRAESGQAKRWFILKEFADDIEREEEDA